MNWLTVFRHAFLGILVFIGMAPPVEAQQDYLLELCRYIVLNPVRAKAVKRLEQWPWSSYAGTVGSEPGPSWLAAKTVRGLFASRAAYKRFVAEGIGADSPWMQLRAQMYLGGEAFLKRVQARLSPRPVEGIARVHLRPSLPRADAIEAAVAKAYGLPTNQILDRGNTQAYKATVYLLRRASNLPLAHVAERAGISPGRVSQIQTEIERKPFDRRLKEIIECYKV